MFLIATQSGAPPHGQAFGPPQDSPATEQETAGDWPEIDRQVRLVMQAIGASAATVAINRDGTLVYSKGFGVSDRRGKIDTSTRSTMRLASCTKPFTAAAIRTLVERGDIALDTPVYSFLAIRPTQELADPRVEQIVVADLLEHRGGWDREQTLDPMYQLEQIRNSVKTRRLEKSHIVRYMWDQPLQFDPGTRRAYSNFGYLLLGLVIEKVTGKSYVESIRELVTDPIGATEITISSPWKQHRQSREVHYTEENLLDLHLRDSSSGLASNAETLCQFMQHYWLDGRKRNRRWRSNRYHYQIGTHPFTTTTLVEQRMDGIDFALMFNSRRNEHYHEDNAAIRDRFNSLMERMSDELDIDR